MTRKPVAEACLRNQQPILEVLKNEFANVNRVYEIGSGTGQHAVFVAERIVHLTWQPTELPENTDVIQAWIDDSLANNVLPPMVLDLTAPEPELDSPFDAGFSANTVHYVSEQLVENLFGVFARALSTEAVLCIYGPFNRNGQYTSDGNVRLDAWLKERDPSSGIKDIEAVIAVAERHGFAFCREHAMPANNLILVFQRVAA